MRFIIIGGGCYGIYHSGQLYKAIQKGKLPADSRLIVVDRNAQPPAMREHGNKPGFVFVQSDWQDFLQIFFSDPQQYDPLRDGDEVQIVPAPFAPHLLFDWLRLSVQSRLAEMGRTDLEVERDIFDEKMSLPFEYTDPKTGNHFISRAGWTCPVACIEPRLCPAVKGVRDWDLDEDVHAVASGQPVHPSVSASARLQSANLPNGVALAEPAPVENKEMGYAGAITFTCHHFSHGIGTVPALRLFEARERVAQTALALGPGNEVARFAVGTVSRCHGVVATLKITRSSK